MSLATCHRKGERPEHYGVAFVTFDENKSDKLYAYWTPPGWDVQPGDKLKVIVREQPAPKWTTSRKSASPAAGGARPAISTTTRHAATVRTRRTTMSDPLTISDDELNALCMMRMESELTLASHDAVDSFLNRAAVNRGFANWLDAFHKLP